MERDNDKQNTASSKLFWTIQDYLEKGLLTEVEVVGILDRLREYYINDAVSHITLLTKEELERLEKENG